MANKNLRLNLWNDFGNKDIPLNDNQQLRNEYLSTLIDLIHLQRPSIPQKVLDYIQNRANFHNSIRYNMSGRYAESSDLQMIIRGNSEDKIKSRIEIQTHNCACYFIEQQPHTKEFDHQFDFPYVENGYNEARFTIPRVEEIYIAPYTTCGRNEAFTEGLGISIQHEFEELRESVVFIGPYIHKSASTYEELDATGKEKEKPFLYSSKSLILFKEKMIDEK